MSAWLRQGLNVKGVAIAWLIGYHLLFHQNIIIQYTLYLQHGNIISQNCSFHFFNCGAYMVGMESGELGVREAKEAREVLEGART